ncbi:MAG UNVERIFIED_CONTAM: hypothetical protein LVR29_29100 [Microcystis novacekii LVE1205-3]
MGMVRSPKSIAGLVGATLGNAPYKLGDRTISTNGFLGFNFCRVEVKLTVKLDSRYLVTAFWLYIRNFCQNCLIFRSITPFRPALLGNFLSSMLKVSRRSQ